MRFRATIQLEGKTATGIRVPPEVVADLGHGKRPPVRVTIGGRTYRSTVAVHGDVFMLPLSAENRAAAGVAAGDDVDVDVELDVEPREVTVPPDFTDALDRDADARRFFDGLSYSSKRRFVLSVEDAKTAETRLRRIAKGVEALREGRLQRRGRGLRPGLGASARSGAVPASGGTLRVRWRPRARPSSMPAA